MKLDETSTRTLGLFLPSLLIVLMVFNQNPYLLLSLMQNGIKVLLRNYYNLTPQLHFALSLPQSLN